MQVVDQPFPQVNLLTSITSRQVVVTGINSRQVVVTVVIGRKDFSQIAMDWWNFNW